jgi:DNA repair protein RecO (recombination protein O)
MSDSRSGLLQRAFVLHTRPYQNTSLLVDFFTEHDGLLRCVAKGQRAKKNASLLSQFCCYQISFSGRSELKTLSKLEMEDKRLVLEKKALYCGLYVNELLLRVLYKHDPHPETFGHYYDLLKTLSIAENLEVSLRQFEFLLLQDIGYLVDMHCDYLSGEKIMAQHNYHFESEKGFTRVISSASDKFKYVFSGEVLIDIADMCFDSEQSQKQAKILSRLMFAPQLGDKPLNSKLMFQSVKPNLDNEKPGNEQE